jgi:pimeloyl-ACP methyl ester carboxylesterase
MRNNRIEENLVGVALAGNFGDFTRNEFLKNETRAESFLVASECDKFPSFSQPLPEGGNHWDVFDSPEEGCVDANSDGICDASYLITATTTDAFGRETAALVDHFPWVKENGWNLPTTTPVTLTDATITEDDGLPDAKGVADKTEFTFNVLYTGTTASSDIILWTNANDTTKSYALSLSATTTNDGDFINGEWYVFTGTFPQGKYGYHFEANGGAARFPTEGELKFTTGYSNVAFLPGIEASRLYIAEILNNQPHGDEDQLWEPNGYLDVEDLFLPENGKSSDGVYTKTSIAEGVIGEVNITPILQGNIYKSFLLDLEKWKNTDHVFADYRVIPYDWRLSIDDILNNGTESNGRLYYADAYNGTQPQYILNQLRQLAANSDTGKVTIIAHSNGGIVAKALLKRLGDANDPLLAKVDNTVLVAVPQLGTPQAIGALLHGFEQGLPFDWFPLLLDPETARVFASTSPMAYHLLPSPKYFSNSGVQIMTPLVNFEKGTTTKIFTDMYGGKIDTAPAFHDFLLGNEGRPQPKKDDTENPSKLKPNFLTYADSLHLEIDNWVPPETMQVYQIAGWGEDTLGGLTYKDRLECVKYDKRGICTATVPKMIYTPDEYIDGDGTVVTPSALAMSTLSPNVTRWWVDLLRYDTIFTFERGHKDIFEIPQLRNFIQKNILTQITKELPAYVSVSTPPTNSKKRLRYYLHSPLTLSVRDQYGNEISAGTSTIPNARFKRFGEVQSISLPADVVPTLVLNGTSEGSFTLEVQEVTGGTVTSTTTFTGIHSNVGTIATMEFPDGTIQNASPLRIDIDGNGTTDISYVSKLNGIVTSDIAPPEAKISVDPNTKDLKIEGVDENPTTVSKNGNVYTITDSSGNKTTLFFQKTFAGKRLTFAKLTAMQYGNEPKISLPSSSFIYLWNPALISQTIAVKKDMLIEAVYNKQKNQTTVLLKKKGMQMQKQIFVGLKVIKLTVDKGAVGYEI